MENTHVAGAAQNAHRPYWEERERKTRAQNKRHQEQQLPLEPLIAPFLWLIAATASTAMLRTLKLEPAPGWPPSWILAEKDTDHLHRWHEKAVVAASVAEVLGESS